MFLGCFCQYSCVKLVRYFHHALASWLTIKSQRKYAQRCMSCSLLEYIQLFSLRFYTEGDKICIDSQSIQAGYPYNKGSLVQYRDCNLKDKQQENSKLAPSICICILVWLIDSPTMLASLLASSLTFPCSSSTSLASLHYNTH